MTPESTTSRVYTDFSALASLKASARQDSPESIKAVAKEFEASFVEMMLKSMRDAENSEGLLDSDATRMYQDMFDKQIAVDISDRGDFGVAEMIEKQLTKKTDQQSQQPDSQKINHNLNQSINNDAQPTSAALVLGFGPSKQLRMHELFSSSEQDEPQNPFNLTGFNQPQELIQNIKRQIHQVQPIIDLNKQGPSIDTIYANRVKQVIPARTTATLDSSNTKFSSPKDFIETLRPHAQRAAEKFGVDADLLIAQAALETGWGKRMIKDQDGSNSHNLFGIKAHGGWKGPSVNIGSLEYRNGIARKEVSPFRAYSSFTESFEDYVKFIKNQPRYEKAIDQAGDRNSYIHALQKAGYATDPDYANKIIDILERKSLQTAWKGNA